MTSGSRKWRLLLFDDVFTFTIKPFLQQFEIIVIVVCFCSLLTSQLEEKNACISE